MWGVLGMRELLGCGSRSRTPPWPVSHGKLLVLNNGPGDHPRRFLLQVQPVAVRAPVARLQAGERLLAERSLATFASEGFVFKNILAVALGTTVDEMPPFPHSRISALFAFRAIPARHECLLIGKLSRKMPCVKYKLYAFD